MSNEKSGIIEDSGIFNYIDQEKPASRGARVPKALVIGAAAVIILAGIQAASGLVGPLLLALFLAIILLVPLRWLQQRGVPHFLAFTIVMICTIALFVGVMYLIANSMNNFIGKIPDLRDEIVVRYEQLEQQLERWGFMIGVVGDGQVEPEPDRTEPLPNGPVVPPSQPEVLPPALVPPPEMPGEAIDPEGAEPLDAESDEADQEIIEWDDVPPLLPEGLGRFIEEMEKEQPSLMALDPQVVTLWLARIALYARHMLEGGFLVLIFTIFMLLEATNFPAKVKRALGKDSPINVEHFHRIADDVRRYLILKTLSNLMSATAAFAVYWAFGVPDALFWGIVAFFMYYIPNLGGTLAAIIPGLLIFIQPENTIGTVLLYAVVLLAVECAIAYGIEPKLLGHGLRLSVLVIILSLFFWGFMLGPIGLFLAAPIIVMIKIILQAFPETRWIAIFLEGGRGEKH